MAAASARQGKLEPAEEESIEPADEPVIIGRGEGEGGGEGEEKGGRGEKMNKDVEALMNDMCARAKSKPQISEEFAAASGYSDTLESDTKMYSFRRYTVLNKTEIRSGIGLDSPLVEVTPQGEAIEAVEVHGDAVGRARIRCATGWASVVSSTTGYMLLEENFAPLIDGLGAPLRLPGERPIAQADATMRTASGSTTVLGMAVVTNLRLVWWQSPAAGRGPVIKRRMSFKSSSSELPEPAAGASCRWPLFINLFTPSPSNMHIILLLPLTLISMYCVY
jgi:hypothetical protein